MSIRTERLTAEGLKHFSRDRNHVYIGAIGGSKAEDTAPKPGIENPVAAIENSVPGIENTNRRVGGARRLSPDTKKDSSCTLAKLESAVHSSLYRSVRKIYAPLAMVNRGLHSHLKFAKLIF